MLNNTPLAPYKTIDTCHNISNNYNFNKKNNPKHIRVKRNINEKAIFYYKKITLLVENKGIGCLQSKKINVILPHLHYYSNNENLFMISSFYIQKILLSSEFSIDNIYNILEKIIVLFNNYNFSRIKKILLIGFVETVYKCLILNDSINNNSCSWYNNNNKSFFYSLLDLGDEYKTISKDLISISLLFIDLDRRFVLNKDTNITIDYGPYVFENEWKYLERCYRAFMYLLNSLVINKCTELSFDHLRKTNAICGGFQGSTASTYNFPIIKEYANNFLYLLEQGKISDKHFSYSSDNLSDEEKAFEMANSINKSLDINIELEAIKDINKKVCFVVKNKKNSIINKDYLSDDENKLLNNLAGNISQSFEFIIIKLEENKISNVLFQLFISYKHDIPKQTVCETLLKIYYKEYKMFYNKDTSLEKVIRAVKLCKLLQRIHLFCDANGRTMFFILLPVLLYQMDMWLLRTVSKPWFKLDFYPAEELAKEILNLCVPAPSIKQQLNWQKKITLKEDFRISCALGDTQRVIQLVNDNPYLLKQPIILTPISKPIPLLNHLVMHNQYELTEYFLNHPEFPESTFSDISTCLQLAKDRPIKVLLLEYIKKIF